MGWWLSTVLSFLINATCEMCIHRRLKVVMHMHAADNKKGTCYKTADEGFNLNSFIRFFLCLWSKIRLNFVVLFATQNAPHRRNAKIVMTAAVKSRPLWIVCHCFHKEPERYWKHLHHAYIYNCSWIMEVDLCTLTCELLSASQTEIQMEQAGLGLLYLLSSCTIVSATLLPG